MPSLVAASGNDVSRMDRWRAEIVAIDGKQRKGKAKRALRATEKLWTEVRERGWREPRLPEILGELAAQMAIAKINLGSDQGHARWLWHTAQLLDEDVMARDWSRYGRAAKVLPELPLRTLGMSPLGEQALTPPFPSGGRLKLPKPGTGKKTPTLPLNRAARFERRMVRPIIEVTIQADGSVSHPAIKMGHIAKPTVLLAVLDMIWLMSPFESGTLDGEPVAIIYPIEIEKFQFLRWDEMFDFQ